MTNTNCLENVRCPQCGYEDGVYITARVELHVIDDGIEDQGGDSDWDRDSPTRCGSCDHEGPLNDFCIDEQKKKAAAEAKGDHP